MANTGELECMAWDVLRKIFYIEEHLFIIAFFFYIALLILLILILEAATENYSLK